MELLFDRGSPAGWVVAAVLLVSGIAAIWLGVRDGFVRREVRATSGTMTGRAAVATGVLYVVTGLLGVWGALSFALG